MPAYPRILQKIFGSALTPAGNVAVIGSAAALAPAYSGDLGTIQSLAQYLSGFNGIVIGNRSPGIQDMNALMLLVTSQIAYLLQSGIPEYEANTTYYVGNIVRVGSAHYTCLVNALTGSNPATDSNNWASGIGKFQAGVTTGGSQVIAVDGNGHKINFNTEITDPYSVFDSGTYKYTAPVRGDYLLGASLQVDNVSGAAATMEMALRAVKNAAVIVATGGESVPNPPGSRWYPKLPPSIVTLAAGDTLEFQLEANDGVNAGNVQVGNSACSIQRI